MNGMKKAVFREISIGLCRAQEVWTMCQKSSLPQAASFVSQVLKWDKAQEVSLIGSWKADSKSLNMVLVRNYPMCENATPLL
jgi:hypothetical protein